VALFERGRISLHYETHGDGFPILLFAPGGMRSAASFWARSPWNPIETLAPHFRVIAMDQRNAGRSRAPITARDGWRDYADDHAALLDHLRVERCHLLGGCIGGSYCLGMIERAPARVASAVLQQPIGLAGGNRQAFYEMFDGWARDLGAKDPSIAAATWSAFRESMYGGDFVFSATRDDVRRMQTPMLVLMGNDLYHPEETSREIVRLAPHAELVERWKEPDAVPATIARVIEFLLRHTPARPR
jgi:pimeloyl-ACP methyl ester carboxylesterase